MAWGYILVMVLGLFHMIRGAFFREEGHPKQAMNLSMGVFLFVAGAFAAVSVTQLEMYKDLQVRVTALELGGV